MIILSFFVFQMKIKRCKTTRPIPQTQHINIYKKQVQDENFAVYGIAFNFKI